MTLEFLRLIMRNLHGIVFIWTRTHSEIFISALVYLPYSFYINHLRLSLFCHHNKIVPKDLQLKSRIKIERRKKMLQRAGKLLLQELIHINHIICDRLKNSIKQLKGKNLESITPLEFHLVGRFIRIRIRNFLI